MLYSPLRYPGGKNKLAKFLAKICVDNKINGHYIEPYAGGASVALYLLFEGYVRKITINDKDRAIYAFWYSILNDTEKFCQLILETPINITEWRRQKEIQKNKEEVDLFTLGFSTFYLNRTNRSGIIKAGAIGGLEQSGNYKIDCRFNKNELISRIRKIAEFRDKIEIRNLDALELIKEIKEGRKSKKTILYFDPPYYLKGESLYMSHYKHNDHEEINKEIQSIKGVEWIVSYDNTPEIENFYGEKWRPFKYGFSHTAFKSRLGKEILFFSKKLQIEEAVNMFDKLVKIRTV